MNKTAGHWKGVGNTLLAAALFGASTPLAKAISPHVEPVLMAGLLNLGSGLGLAAYAGLRAGRKRTAPQEAALTRKDVPWLAGAILAGGVIGPVLLMWGLAITPASSASLLLNLEGVLTALLAWFIFRENCDARIALGMALIAAGGLCLTWLGGACRLRSGSRCAGGKFPLTPALSRRERESRVHRLHMPGARLPPATA